MSKRFTAVNTLLVSATRNKNGGFAKVKFQLTAKVTKALEWPEMPEGTAEWCPDVDELKSSLVEFTPNNEELRDKATSIDAISIGEGGAGARMLSPAAYEECLLPVHQRLISRIHGPTIMHICGDVRSRLHLLAQTGMTCFNFDWAVPPAEMAAAAAGKFSIMGNINTTDLLCAAPAEIARQVEECLAAGVHIISPGCATSPKCPNANLRAMSEAICRAQS